MNVYLPLPIHRVLVHSDDWRYIPVSRTAWREAIDRYDLECLLDQSRLSVSEAVVEQQDHSFVGPCHPPSPEYGYIYKTEGTLCPK